MHPPATVAIEIDPLPVVAVLRTVVQPFGFGQPDFFAGNDVRLVHIPFPVSYGTVGNPLVIGADAMPVTGVIFGNQPRNTPGCRQDENTRVASRGADP